jgi:hypothetical protein
MRQHSSRVGVLFLLAVVFLQCVRHRSSRVAVAARFKYAADAQLFVSSRKICPARLRSTCGSETFAAA